MTPKLATLGYGRDVFRPDHEAFRETARRFMQREVEPNVRQWEKDGFFPAELFRKAGAAGLLCAAIPEEYGGGGGDILHHIILHEEHAYTPAAASLEGGLLTDFVSFALHQSGTEEQKREWLPFFASGEGIAEIGLSEPDAGSDAQGIKTFARRDGDDWVINGQKAWITNGPILTVLFVVANTRTDGGRDGKSIFIVPMDAKGVSRQTTDLMAKTCGGVGEIFFTDVRVPARNLLGGAEGNGLRAALGLIGVGRLATGARSTAACEVALDITLDYVKTRRAFGQTIFQFQNTQFQLASMATEIAAARAFVDKTIKAAAEDRLEAAETAKLRLFCTEVEGRVMDTCLQLHGGIGFSNEHIISKMYALARVHRIYGGTSEIMRDIIARAM
jgi:alkylation response protein AidB-like acyl-CoA dehydrogenase